MLYRAKIIDDNDDDIGLYFNYTVNGWERDVWWHGFITADAAAETVCDDCDPFAFSAFSTEFSVAKHHINQATFVTNIEIHSLVYQMCSKKGSTKLMAVI